MITANTLGRDVKPSVHGEASVTSSQDTIMLSMPGHVMVIEKDRLLLDKVERAKVPAAAKKFVINQVRYDELAQMLAADPKVVRSSGNSHAALATQAATPAGRACAEIQLKIHSTPFSKDATPEQLVTKLEELLGVIPTP